MRFYFKALFNAATIRGQLHFEDGVYRDPHIRMLICSINNEPILYYVCMYNAHVYTCTYIVVNLYHVVRFQGGMYWDELAEICGDISRVPKFQRNSLHKYLKDSKPQP